MKFSSFSLLLSTFCCCTALCLSGCANSNTAANRPPKSAAAAPASHAPFTERDVIGEWVIDVDKTADVLARARFAPRTEITIKAGAARPETNLVTQAFDQKKFDEIKATWLESLREPEMQWRLVLRPDHSGEHIAHDMKSGKPKASPLKWTLQGDALRLEYPEEKRLNTFTCRLVSSNELHYPMQPLGGWMVMRRK